jgi:hypothetical protein
MPVLVAGGVQMSTNANRIRHIRMPSVGKHPLLTCGLGNPKLDVFGKS